MVRLTVSFKQGRIINFLFFNFIIYFVLILPYFLNSIAMFRFDYAVYTIPIYIIFIFGSELIIKLFSGKILKIIFDDDKNFKRSGLICIFLINSILSILLFLLYIENRIYWASDSMLMAIYLLIFFIFEYLLLMIMLNSGIDISRLSNKVVIIGALYTVVTYLTMIFTSSIVYLSLIVLYLFSNILINYPKEFKFKKKVPESTLQNSDLDLDYYIKNRKTKYLLASTKYFTFFLCSLLIAINSIRIFFDLNIWAIHFLVFSISFFLILYICFIFYGKRIIRNEEILLMVIITISFIETVLLLVFPIEMTFKVALLVFIFNIIHGATLSLLIFYIIIVIKNLTKSNYKSKINRDLFIHIYSVMWLIAALLVYLGFGYLLNEVEWLNPNYILFSIALILLISAIFLLQSKKKLRETKNNNI